MALISIMLTRFSVLDTASIYLFTKWANSVSFHSHTSWVIYAYLHLYTINAMIKSESSASEKQAPKKLSPTLGGSSTNVLSKLEVLEKIRQIHPSQFYVWDGQDLDDKPLTAEQLAAKPCKNDQS